jgi:hypothetical protein
VIIIGLNFGYYIPEIVDTNAKGIIHLSELYFIIIELFQELY